VYPRPKCSLSNRNRHPEAKSLAPDEKPCVADTKGMLKRAYVIAGEIWYVGKATDRRWEQGEESASRNSPPLEYGRSGKVIASEEIKAAIQKMGINKCARESGFDRKNPIPKLARGIPVKPNSYSEFVAGLEPTVPSPLRTSGITLPVMSPRDRFVQRAASAQS